MPWLTCIFCDLDFLKIWLMCIEILVSSFMSLYTCHSLQLIQKVKILQGENDMSTICQINYRTILIILFYHYVFPIYSWKYYKAVPKGAFHIVPKDSIVTGWQGRNGEWSRISSTRADNALHWTTPRNVPCSLFSQ